MKIEKISTRSKRQLILADLSIGGTIVMIDGELYIYPIEDDVTFNYAYSNHNIALVCLETGEVVEFSQDCACAIVNGKFTYTDDDVNGWI